MPIKIEIILFDWFLEPTKYFKINFHFHGIFFSDSWKIIMQSLNNVKVILGEAT